MPKFVAPEHIDHFLFDEVDYRRDENGHFDIRHPDHQEKALMHGAKRFVEGEDAVFDEVIPVRLPGADEEIAARDAEIEELKAKIAAMQAAPVATETQAASGATDTPADGADALGGTSSSTGATAETVDIDAMSRDDLVAHLAAKGTSVPANISKAEALKIAKGE